MSLRTIHMLFILLVIVSADLFGAWTVWNFTTTGNGWLLGLGIAAVAGGFGLIWYAYRLVARLDKAGIA